MYKLAHVFHVV